MSSSLSGDSGAGRLKVARKLRWLAGFRVEREVGDARMAGCETRGRPDQLATVPGPRSGCALATVPRSLRRSVDLCV
jgi:hypothetical protein